MAVKFVACYYCLGWGFEADFSGGNYTPDLFGGNCTPLCGRCGSNGYMNGEELQSSEELEGESYEERQK
ncbi:hypothetical protein N7465_010579 [Penicillium sp. CMV-2018d]|nr:hypothetical protein N7465_010579 [Penicillium sp. CMV-2018d]